MQGSIRFDSSPANFRRPIAHSPRVNLIPGSPPRRRCNLSVARRGSWILVAFRARIPETRRDILAVNRRPRVYVESRAELEITRTVRQSSGRALFLFPREISHWFRGRSDGALRQYWPTGKTIEISGCWRDEGFITPPLLFPFLASPFPRYHPAAKQTTVIHALRACGCNFDAGWWVIYY